MVICETADVISRERPAQDIRSHFFAEKSGPLCDTNHFAHCQFAPVAVREWGSQLRRYQLSPGGSMLSRRDILIGTGLAGFAALARPFTHVLASAAQPRTPL